MLKKQDHIILKNNNNKQQPKKINIMYVLKILNIMRMLIIGYVCYLHGDMNS